MVAYGPESECATALRVYGRPLRSCQCAGVPGANVFSGSVTSSGGCLAGVCVLDTGM